MSAQPHPTTTSDATDDDVPPDIDAYPIDIPDVFIEAFAGETVIEKLRNAEAAPSTNGKAERDGCPECGSVRVHRKTGFDSQHEVDQPYRCTNCGAHVAGLVPPAIGARDDTQLGLDVFNDDEPLYRNGEWLRAQYVDAELTVLQMPRLPSNVAAPPQRCGGGSVTTRSRSGR